MTLFRQLFIGVSLGFLLLLAGIEYVYVSNARTYLQDQLASHAQDAATSLGLVLSSSLMEGDTVRAEILITSLFDRGYFQSIRLMDMEGKIEIQKTLSPVPPDVPAWFAARVNLEAPTTEALVTGGWRQLGRVMVSSHPNFAYLQLWRTTRDTTLWMLGFYALSLMLLHRFLRTILGPLHEIEDAARAIGERNFKIIAARPASRELAIVVNAINTMTGRLRGIIESEISAAQRYRSLAFSDELTGLDNRRSFEQRLQAALSAGADMRSGALYLIQIADLGSINAARGYGEGDAVLKRVADSLSGVGRKGDPICARVGGATFAVAAFNLDRGEAARLGQTLTPQTGNEAFGCGGVYFSNDQVSLHSLMAESDLALQQSLTEGGTPVLADCRQDAAVSGRGSLAWKTFIEDALNENRCALLLQPVVAFEKTVDLPQEVIGRLADEKGKAVAAAEFMPMAARHGLTAAIDARFAGMLADAVRQGKIASRRLAINFSAHSMQDAGLMSDLQRLLTSAQKAGSTILFELSEFALTQHLDVAEKFAAMLRASGADLAVDNFGLHHAAFEYLLTLQPAYIKLGPAYIAGIKDKPESQHFVSSVVKIAKPLGVRTIALGAEDPDTLELLRKLGVDGYQGFMSGAPQRVA